MTTQPNPHLDLTIARAVHILGLLGALLGFGLWVTGELGLAAPLMMFAAAGLALAAGRYEQRHRTG